MEVSNPETIAVWAAIAIIIWACVKYQKEVDWLVLLLIVCGGCEATKYTEKKDCSEVRKTVSEVQSEIE